jgi:hypothetical protein
MQSRSWLHAPIEEYLLISVITGNTGQQMVEQFLINLRTSLSELTHGSQQDFENGFAPLHIQWHDSQPSGPGSGGEWIDSDGNAYTIGFLSFHAEAVNALGKVPFADLHLWSEQDSPPGPHPPYPAALDSISDPHEFSTKLETWHDDVHDNTVGSGGEYPDAFSDRAQNIKMAMFWWWHSLINNLFMSWLSNNNIDYDSGIDHEAV